jgi:hypothetical protein
MTYIPQVEKQIQTIHYDNYNSNDSNDSYKSNDSNKTIENNINKYIDTFTIIYINISLFGNISIKYQSKGNN